jgi:hypothetical protein
MSCPPSFPDGESMAVIGLVAVGLVGNGFMLYVLFQWTRETVRNSNK